MTKQPRKITQEDVDRSYELANLLEVCKGAAEEISGRQPPYGPLVQLAGALPSVIQLAIDKWSDVHDALELAQRDQERAGAAQDAFDDLFGEWKTVHETSGPMPDEEATRLNETESKLIERIVATPAMKPGQIAAKVYIAKTLIGEPGSNWSDERDMKVLDSITADLEKLKSSA